VIDRYAPNANNARCQPSTRRRRWRQLRLRNERPVRCDSIDRINRLVCVAVALRDAIIRRRGVTCAGVRFRLGERRQDNRDPALPRFLTLALAGALDRRKRVRRPKSAPGSKADLKEPMIDVRSSPESRHSQTQRRGPLCATTGLMHRSKTIATRSPRRRGQEVAAAP
jgi:hypothetical protein